MEKKILEQRNIFLNYYNKIIFYYYNIDFEQLLNLY